MEIRVSSLLSSFGATGARSGVTPSLALPSSVSRCGCRLPRTPHLRVLPAFDLQVALNLESFQRFQRFSSSGFPHNSISPVTLADASRVAPLLHLPALPATDHRVAPNLESFSASGVSVRVTPNLALPSSACRCRFRFPGSCIFRLCRQRILELPRISRSSAPPVLELSVSLELRSSRLRLPMSLTSFPASFIFRLSLRFELPGDPGCSLPRRRLMDHRVSPVLAPSGSAVPASSGFPESCIYGWVDDWSRSSRTLHPRLSPRMNLRIQSGFATSVPRLWMHSFNLIQAFYLPANQPAKIPTSTAFCIVLSRWSCDSNSLLAHQLEWSLGPVHLWKQVQNMNSLVDFTSVGA